MGSVLVVVVTKRVELELQVSQRKRPGLFSQEALQRLMEALDFATGLRVIGGRVNAADAEAFKLGFEDDFAAPRTAAEDGRVVAQQTRREAVGLGGRKE